ncbi:HD domain-containing protein [Paenalkalicoccus suaedae]|uniref:HD domain-containing protein n=1 Tax=Paenalkalicoccus suaedae TaxID=2592382 RepID=A0A859FHY9_9BACI|nr:HD domain-containing phosphohydrolase [Paenalkalicoccus suaedae]QKS72757.1 HD domain-containing protein [Paenalkalicoccus suaedae]
MLVNIHVNQADERYFLAEDLYMQGRLLMKAGGRFSPRIRHLLQQQKITHVTVTEDKSYIGRLKKQPTLEDAKVAKKAFFDMLTHVGEERRYGNSLHKMADFKWIEGLFVMHMEDPGIRQAVARMEATDPLTLRHTFDTFIFGSLLARRLLLTDIHAFSQACLLHDIGKTSLPTEILHKSPLTADELTELRAHIGDGYRLLQKLYVDKQATAYVKAYGEFRQFYVKAGERRPYLRESQLLSIVDMYSALTLPKPYRKAFPAPKALEMILGKQRWVAHDLLYELCKLLEIFPAKSIVELTNGEKLAVKSVYDNAPTLPTLTDGDPKNDKRLPTNLSVSVANLIHIPY